MKKQLNIEFENVVFWYLTRDMSIPEMMARQGGEENCIISSASQFVEQVTEYKEFYIEDFAKCRRFRQSLQERDIKWDAKINVDMIKKIEDANLE
tara:strand:+ start:239 stop:523 length:285 start_codon:yes stop_codon:yes gene_type:complete